MKVKKFAHHSNQECRIGSCFWDCSRLFQLTKHFDVFEIPLMHLSVDYYYNNLTLRELAGHMEAVNNADLSYPIILDEDGVVMDGRHRIIKCLLNDIETIKAVRFYENPEPCRRSQE